MGCGTSAAILEQLSEYCGKEHKWINTMVLFSTQVLSRKDRRLCLYPCSYVTRRCFSQWITIRYYNELFEMLTVSQI